MADSPRKASGFYSVTCRKGTKERQDSRPPSANESRRTGVIVLNLALPKLSLRLEPIVYVVAMFATTALVNLVRTTANRAVGNGCGWHLRSICGHRMSMSIRPAALFLLHALAF
jgi:hypothetical protein